MIADLQELENLCAFLEEQQPWRTRPWPASSSALQRPQFLDLAITQIFTMQRDQMIQEVHPYLEFIGDPMARRLVDRLGEETDRTRRGRLVEVVRSMGSISVPALLDALASPAWFLVRNALTLLSDIGDTGCIPSILPLLRHPEPRVRRTAVRALWKLGGPVAEPHLLAQMKETDAETMQEILFALGQLRSESSLPQVTALAQDKRVLERLRIQALDTLGHIASPKAMPVLLECMRRKGFFNAGEPPAIRMAAAKALAALGTPEAAGRAPESGGCRTEGRGTRGAASPPGPAGGAVTEVQAHPDPRQLLEAFEAFTAASEHLQARYEALQSQLGQLQGELQTVIEAVPFAIWVLAEDGSLRFTNRPQGLDGRFLQDPAPWECGSPGGQRRFQTAEGRELIFEEERRSAPHGGTIVTLRDVTEAVLRAQQATREDRLAAMGRMAAELAHEIRNPSGEPGPLLRHARGGPRRPGGSPGARPQDAGRGGPVEQPGGQHPGLQPGSPSQDRYHPVAELLGGRCCGITLTGIRSLEEPDPREGHLAGRSQSAAPGRAEPASERHPRPGGIGKAAHRPGGG